MKKAFTLVELMIVVAVMATVAALVIPSAVAEKDKRRIPYGSIPYGSTAIITASGLKVTVVRQGESFNYVVCRVDYGEKAIPRFQELEFLRTELTAAPTPVEVEKAQNAQ